jgi:hypothetical protein
LHRIQTNMERGFVMFFHAIIIAVILYLIMFYVLRQNSSVAENRSILIGAVALIYMILFGHGLPTKINKL